MNILIRSILDDKDLETSANVIRVSFLTVAREFSLTPENNPTNAAFIKFDDLLKMNMRGIAMFGMFEEESQIGFVAIETAGKGLFYMEKLAVLPEYRHRGYGEAIINFVSEYVKREGGSRVSIGIIDHHDVLKNWYKTCGFTITGTKSLYRLPFKVCFLSKRV